MMILPVPSIQDVARLVCPTVPETVEKLKGYYAASGPFSYDHAKRVAKLLYSGEISLDAAMFGCLTTGNPLGRQSNAEVVKHIWRAAQGRELLCYALSRRQFKIHRDLSIGVHPPFYFVENLRPKLYWLQPRRRYALTAEQLGILASVIKMAFVVDDFEEAGAELELFDVSIPQGGSERAPRILNFSDLPLLSESGLQDALERFAEAYFQACELGIERAARRKGKRDDRQRPLFD